MAKFSLFYPLKPWRVNQPFGSTEMLQFYKDNGLKITGHNGIDAEAKDGQVIYAAHDGVVTFCGEDGSAGLGIVIRTEQEFDYNYEGQIKPVYYKTIYWHIQKGSFKVKAGDRVKAGDPIACADNTGLSTGTHLHFGLKPVRQGEADWQWYNLLQDNGVMGAIDPAPYWNNYYAEDSTVVLGIMETIIKLLKEYVQFRSEKRGNIN